MIQTDHVTYLQGLYAALISECGEHYPALRRGLERDLSRLLSCAKTRGLHYFTVDLPAYGKHFDKCLSKGRLFKGRLPGMGGFDKGSRFPKLFSGLWRLVFGADGNVLPTADAQAILLIRTLCYCAKKWKVTCANSKTFKEVKEFYSVDSSLRSPSLEWGHVDFSSDAGHRLTFADDLRQNSRNDATPWLPGLVVPGSRSDEVCILADYRRNRERSQLERTPIHALSLAHELFDKWAGYIGVFNAEEWMGRHGPGVVSDLKKDDRSKYDFPTWSEKLETVFPLADVGFANHAAWAEFAESQDASRYRTVEHPSRLAAVPKTQKKPRLIAAEPTANQWCQQALQDFLRASVNRTFLRNAISFKDQTPNQRLALAASRTGENSTIDLSSASDRLSCWFAERAFRANPSLLRALNASRTGWIANLVDKKSPKYYRLRKLSTMGSAITFPVQSICFAILAMSCVDAVLYSLSKTGTPVGEFGFNEEEAFDIATSKQRILERDVVEWKSIARRDIASWLSRKVRVFGDDIICPWYAQDVLKLVLEVLDFKVNDDKTFGLGRFRESCGVDAYDGHDVTPAYVLTQPEQARPESIVSSVATVHNFATRGLWMTSHWIEQTVRKAMPQLALPTVDWDSGVFGWRSHAGPDLSHLQWRWSETYQQKEYRVHVVKTREVRKPDRPDSRLLQYFTEAPEPTSPWASGFTVRTQTFIRPAWVLESSLLRKEEVAR